MSVLFITCPILRKTRVGFYLQMIEENITKIIQKKSKFYFCFYVILFRRGNKYDNEASENEYYSHSRVNEQNNGNFYEQKIKEDRPFMAEHYFSNNQKYLDQSNNDQLSEFKKNR